MRSSKELRRWLAIGAATAALGGAGAVAGIAATGGPDAPAPAEAAQSPGDMDEPGEVEGPMDGEGPSDADEDQEKADDEAEGPVELPPGAISEADARAAAAGAVSGGTAGEVELEEHDGSVGYEVKVTDAQGREQEVAVDPATGKVVHTEPED